MGKDNTVELSFDLGDRKSLWITRWKDKNYIHFKDHNNPKKSFSLTDEEWAELVDQQASIKKAFQKMKRSGKKKPSKGSDVDSFSDGEEEEEDARPQKNNKKKQKRLPKESVESSSGGEDEDELECKKKKKRKTY